MSNVRFINNDEGVSPIVATLVLIVVAIVGAAAVGLIMGSFSSNVSNQANSGNTAASASSTLQIAGSSSMLPTITTIAGYYNSNNTGVRVVVSGGGSGAGCVAVGSGIADIGMMSENPTSAQMAKYPNLKTYQVGESGVVFATMKDPSYTSTTVTRSALATAFGNISGTFGGAPDYTAISALLGGNPINETVTRSDVSGTSDTAFNWLGSTSGTVQPTGSSVVSKNGNGDVAKEIYSGAGKIGYLESDYAFGTDNSKFTILNIKDDWTSGQPVYTTTDAHIQNMIMYNYGKIADASANGYPVGLLRPLNLVTNGAPSTIEQSFINYVSNPQFQKTFQANHQIHISQVASSLSA